MAPDEPTGEPGRATAFCPACIGNVAVGYDVLGAAVEALGDRVTVRRLKAPVVRVGTLSGRAMDLPTEPAKNTATAALLDLREAHGIEMGFEVSIEKGIPLKAGLGGSAASAVGAVVAAADLLPGTWGPDALLPHALAGEVVASGEVHPDNVVPCLYGGLVLTQSVNPPDVVPLPVPSGLWTVLVRPDVEVATRDARTRVPGRIPVSDATQQMAHLGAFVAGCFQEDLSLVGRALRDRIAEPYRSGLVPAFDDVRDGARKAGALGCSLSGSGPTLFAWCDGRSGAEAVRDRMASVFAEHGVETDTWVTTLSEQGAHIVERDDRVDP